MNKETNEVVHVYVDAACTGDPGICGIGIFLKHPDGIVERYSKASATSHIHAAEFEALLFGLKIASSKGYTHARFFTDSQLVEQSVNQGKVKRAIYKSLLHDILLVSADFRLFIVKWIKSEQNKEADYLAKQGIHKELEK